MYDLVIIGAGVTGCCIAREISRYKINACVIEKGDDVASGTSKANTGVIHTGLEADPGSLMAKLCVRGNELMYEWAKELDFPAEKNGKLIVCTHEDDLPLLDKQLENAIANGVPDCEILDREEVLRREPNLTERTVAALWAPTGGIVCPFNVAVAAGENACVNGVEFRFETEADSIEKTEYGYLIHTNKGDIETKAIANAAGLYADKFHNMVSENKIHITARKGEYIFFDKSIGTVFNTTVVPLPGKMGKGIAASYTINGNFFIGPTATDVEDKEELNTTEPILEKLKAMALSNQHLTKNPLPLNKVITSFAGARAHEDHHEFIVEELSDAPYFFDAAGIESPGLTSSPAIGEMLSGIIADKMKLQKKENFIAKRKGFVKFDALSDEEKEKLIKENPLYGNIVCRCEMVTEAQIVDAINRPIKATSLDAVKRRVRAGMGRCQGGFCTPKTMEIISRELGIDMTEVTKKGGKSKLLTGRVKE
ncbi:MAG: NAD(P)/FAD-dependent oxidoreductase [Lachnospiraceae bacterium]|nr:NAD(P)/FAD-dependent oxidoreductase [Lachnospiraceae bacterium]